MSLPPLGPHLSGLATNRLRLAYMPPIKIEDFDHLSRCAHCRRKVFGAAPEGTYHAFAVLDHGVRVVLMYTDGTTRP